MNNSRDLPPPMVCPICKFHLDDHSLMYSQAEYPIGICPLVNHDVKRNALRREPPMEGVQ